MFSKYNNRFHCYVVCNFHKLSKQSKIGKFVLVLTSEGKASSLWYMLVYTCLLNLNMGQEWPKQEAEKLSRRWPEEAENGLNEWRVNLPLFFFFFCKE